LVEDFVRACPVCQRNKTEALSPAGLLQPLAVPSAVWCDISMDFIEALPCVQGKTVILSVVDRFSKYAHFIPLAHPYTALSVARAFFDDIVRLHGLPQSIVSDRDPVFTSNFWKDIFRLSGVRLHMSSAFHPQSDGQTDVVNKVIAMYLRCMTGDRPRQWLDWLPWAEYCYKTSYHSSLRETPFKVVYGRDPPALPGYSFGEAKLASVETALRERAEFIVVLQERVLQAQQRSKHYYDANHRELSFEVRD
jgi:transposase InsO family protein